MFKRPDPEEISDEEFARMGTTREALRKRHAFQDERAKQTPQVGSEAPDFEIERLSTTGQRTGEMFRLSTRRGKPVALVFGSYT